MDVFSASISQYLSWTGQMFGLQCLCVCVCVCLSLCPCFIDRAAVVRPLFSIIIDHHIRFWYRHLCLYRTCYCTHSLWWKPAHSFDLLGDVVPKFFKTLPVCVYSKSMALFLFLPLSLSLCPFSLPLDLYPVSLPSPGVSLSLYLPSLSVLYCFLSMDL